MKNFEPQIEELHLMHKKNYLLLRVEFSLALDRAVQENNLADMNHYKKRLEELEIDYQSTLII